MTPHSSRMSSRRGLYSALTFKLSLLQTRPSLKYLWGGGWLNKKNKTNSFILSMWMATVGGDMKYSVAVKGGLKMFMKCKRSCSSRKITRPKSPRDKMNDNISVDWLVTITQTQNSWFRWRIISVLSETVACPKERQLCLFDTSAEFEPQTQVLCRTGHDARNSQLSAGLYDYEVRASQVGGHSAGQDLYTACVTQLTENMVVQWETAAAVWIRRQNHATVLYAQHRNSYCTTKRNPSDNRNRLMQFHLLG